MIDDMNAMFDKLVDEHSKFERIENPPSQRPDVTAFILLDRLVPPCGRQDMIAASEHDEIWLDVDVGELAKVATEEDILALVRCGVDYDEHNDSLRMFT